MFVRICVKSNSKYIKYALVLVGIGTEILTGESYLHLNCR